MERILIENEGPFVDPINLAIKEAFKLALEHNVDEVAIVYATKGSFFGSVFEDVLGEPSIKNLLEGKKIPLCEDVHLSFLLPKDCSSARTPKILLASYLSLELMSILDANPHLTALVFLPWNADEGKKWLNLWMPNVKVVGDLGWVDHATPFKLHDEVEKALTSIIFKTVTHPNDKERVKLKFKALKVQGQFLSAEDTKSWAIKNGWAERDAKNLADIAATIFK